MAVENLTDDEIMVLPDWQEALDKIIAEYRRDNLKEPQELVIRNLIEILINRYRGLGYLTLKRR